LPYTGSIHHPFYTAVTADVTTDDENSAELIEE
jgi:hypothetical protein